MKSYARKHITNTRFGDRRKRITRRTERDNFRCIVMPALYVIGILGVVAFCATAIYAAVADAEVHPFFPIVVGPVLLIGVMEMYERLTKKETKE